MTAATQRRRFSVHDYYRMAEAGILGPDDRVELINGEVVEKPPIGANHASAVDRINWHLARGWIWRPCSCGCRIPCD